MTNTEINLMREAITWAAGCQPAEERIPKVGAIIAVEGKVIGRGRRGTGIPGDDEHAEHNALQSVTEGDRGLLPKATVYTTLEPCTPEVRSNPLKCCTELILQAEVKRVFIGILDPNQGVRGKGLWELQNKGIEVALFPHDLAKEIRSLNAPFIRAQRSLGILIIEPKHGQTIRTYDKGGKWVVKGRFLNPPGADVFAFVVGPNGHWSPQPHLLEQTGRNEWQVTVHFGRYGPHSIFIVKASELGVVLVNYYRKVITSNLDRTKRLRANLKDQGVPENDILRGLPNDYQAVEMGKLPKGFEFQAMVAVDVEEPPKA